MVDKPMVVVDVVEGTALVATLVGLFVLAVESAALVVTLVGLFVLAILDAKDEEIIFALVIGVLTATVVDRIDVGD